MNLWIFGHSACTRHGLNDNNKSWMDVIESSKSVKQTFNLAEEGSDNLRIYHNLTVNLSSISKDDIVIIGWSHPSRKSFVLDQSNQTHLNLLNQDVLVYNGEPVFFRSKNPRSDTWSIDSIKYIGRTYKQQKGNPFFDAWFHNYYSLHESKLNFQGYLDSAKLSLNCCYLPFYFSKESVEEIQTAETVYYLDYILQTKNYISKRDLHLNDTGHLDFAELLLQRL